jgi:RND family efflux transporter MFP subunit
VPEKSVHPSPPLRHHRRTHPRQLVLVGLLAGVLTVGSGCRKSGAAASGPPRESGPPRAVQTVAVTGRSLERTVTVFGSLAAFDQATLGVKVSGRLERIDVDLGTTVRKGQAIARIEPRDYELRLQQAEAQLAQVRARLGLPPEADDRVQIEQTSAVKAAKAVLEEATKNRDRVTRLVSQGVTAQSELETAQAGYEVAANRFDSTLEEMRSLVAQLAQRKAEVEIARQQLSDTTITAPFDGAIQERRASVGEYLPAGAPLATLVRIDPLRLRLEVPEREAARVATGQPVRLTVEGDTNVYRGTITRLSPAISESNRMLIVEADVPARGALRPGLFARAEIVTSTDEPGLVVPRAALVVFAGLEKVFSIKDGKAVERLVSTGRRGADWIEIVRGVNLGEPVILQPGNLQAGNPVTTDAAAPGGKTRPAKPVAKGATAGGTE